MFFDVGAHVGDKSQQFLNKKLKVLMIEPLPKCVEQLKLKFKDSSTWVIRKNDMQSLKNQF